MVVYKNGLRDASAPPRLPYGRGVRSSAAGFSLLEVMVAIAILGLGLTAILSAQAGAFSAAQHARSLSLATGLARCKMLELEEKINRDGFQETDEQDAGPCCDSDEGETMRCTWRIEKPELPAAQLGELDLDTDLNLGGTPGGGTSGGSSAAIGALTSLTGDSGLSGAVGQSGNMSDLAQGMAGSLASSGGIDGIVGMMMGLVYPDLKAMFESGVRRVIVTVHWADGATDRSLEVMQWYTSPAPVVAAAAAAATAAGVSTSTGTAPSR